MKNKAVLGYIFGMLCALCWSISPVFIRRGLGELPFPIWGTAIGMSAAALVYLIWFSLAKKWQAIREYDRVGLIFQILAGVTSGIGIAFRNVALDFATVVVVISIAQSTSLFTLIFGPLLFRETFERITGKLVAGIILLLLGSLLILFAHDLQNLTFS
jgi:uncharacterized membrane protein